MKNAPCKNCNKPIEDEKKSSFCIDCRSIMGKRSKRKGSANESRFAKYLNGQFEKYKLPYVAKRTPRSGGIQEFEPSDMMFRFLPTESIFKKLHFELKNTAQWSIVEWITEAELKEKNMGSFRMPIPVIRHPSERQEYVVMKAEDAIELLVSNDLLRNET